MTVTSEDVQRYVRIAIYLLSGGLTQHGFTDAGGIVMASSGIVLGMANLAWSIYGMRVNAKIAELSKIAQDPTTPVAGVIMTPTVEGRRVAEATPGPTVVAGSDAAKQLAGA